MMVSELQQRGKLEIYGLYFIYKTKTINYKGDCSFGPR